VSCLYLRAPKLSPSHLSHPATKLKRGAVHHRPKNRPPHWVAKSEARAKAREHFSTRQPTFFCHTSGPTHTPTRALTVQHSRVLLHSIHYLVLSNFRISSTLECKGLRGSDLQVNCTNLLAGSQASIARQAESDNIRRCPIHLLARHSHLSNLIV